ncbi:unnamed protein product [Closterium sp. NIES-53]
MNYERVGYNVSEESKSWELLDIADNRVITTSDVVFYENMSLEVWKSEHGPALGRTPTIPPMDTSTATLPLLTEVGEPAAEDVEDVLSPFPSPAPRAPPLVTDLLGLTSVSASSDEGRSGASPVAPTKGIACGADQGHHRHQLTGEQAAAKQTKKQSATRHSAEEPTTGEKSEGKPAEVQQDDEGCEVGDDGGDAEESTDSDVVEVQRGPRQSGRIRRPPDFYVPAAFTTAYDEVDDDLQYKGKAVKAAMEEEIRSLVGMGTWELVERPPGVNIMKNWWVLTTKYHIDDTVEHEKARLVVKGFTQVYGADYDETYAPMSSYIMLRIFLSIVAVLDLNLMQLDMKNAFLQSKLDRVLYLYQPDYFNDRTGRQCSDAEGAANGRLQATGDLAGAEVPRAGDLARQVSEEAVAASAGLCRQGRPQHWREVDRCLAYLANTRDTALELSGGAEWLKLVGYVDADDTGDKQNRTSTGGYVFVFGGAAVSWSSQRIKCATLSPTESEYMAATKAGKEGRRLRFLLAEFRRFDARMPTLLRVDNKSAITVAEGMGLTGNFKHMERRQAWLRHMVKRRKFSQRYIPTAEQPADNLMKALHYLSFNRCSVAIGQVHLVDMGDGDNDVQQQVPCPLAWLVR